MTTITVSGFKIRKGERLYGTYVRYALYKATVISEELTSTIFKISKSISLTVPLMLSTQSMEKIMLFVTV